MSELAGKHSTMATKKQELLIVGNWKMNPSTLGNARKLFLDVRERMGKRAADVQVVVAPPVPYIGVFRELSPTGRIALGAQDVSREEAGAHTGEMGASMLKSVGVSHVIVGHSERRAAGETEEQIAAKLQQVLGAKLTAILCVGETKRDKQGAYFTTVETQLTAALQGVATSAAKHLVVAYEPVWAIGTGNDPEPEQVEEMKLFIQKVLADRFGRAVIAKVRILYGGSVTPKNAEALLVEGKVDGLLIGGASLRARDFTEIIHIAHVRS